MAKNKPAIPKGTRDFGPLEMSRRQYIYQHIKQVFQKYGFMPLETPSMENLDVLTGKYGDEGDQLIFKILNSGDFLKKTAPEDYNEGSKAITSKISEKALRYDLTVPFARYVVMNRHQVAFPFKRYQIQPVWRADRPQKGRYREFYQCDADVIGTDSLLCEAELILMYNEVFELLGITSYTIKINHRKLLSGLAALLGMEDRETELFVAIDKLDKKPINEVLDELISQGVPADTCEILSNALAEGKNLPAVETLLNNTQHGTKGVTELKEIFRMVMAMGRNDHHLEFDLSLARGLSYYTGAIFEVKVHDVKIGSIAAGGRYDNLTGVFGMPDVSGVGISFGVDRIYDVMEALELFPEDTGKHTTVLLCPFDETAFEYGLKTIPLLRNEGIAAELYPEPVKMKKQLNYANQKNIPYTIVIGDNELKSGTLTIKDMTSGEQSSLGLKAIIDKLRS